jgi:hypothetical protein
MTNVDDPHQRRTSLLVCTDSRATLYSTSKTTTMMTILTIELPKHNGNEPIGATFSAE